MYYGELSKNDIVNLFYCKGDFSSENKKLNDIDFTLVQYADSKINIILRFPNNSNMIHIINDYINNSNTTYSIKGNLIEEEGEVIIREAKISQLNLNLFNDKDI